MTKIEKLQAIIRNVVSHATMGSSSGEGMGLNEICVEISRMRNVLYASAKEYALKKCLGVVDDFIKEGRISEEVYEDMIAKMKEKVGFSVDE